MKKLRLQPVLSDETTNNLIGKFIDNTFIKHHIKEDTEVYNEKNELLAVLKKNAVSKKNIELARLPLRKAASTSYNRGKAAGELEKILKIGDIVDGHVVGKIKGSRYIPLIKNGKLSNTSYALPVKSSVIGYMDRYPRMPYCRTTAYTQKNLSAFKSCLPYIKDIDTVFKTYAPHRYAKQKGMADASSPDFVIKDTSFTTVTVNKNFRTACHTDAGDFAKGFGNLGVISMGKYEGFITVIPKYGLGIDVQNSDIALFDVHEVHGNTEPVKITHYERISVVCYYREKMIYCGSQEYELNRAKTETKKVALQDELEKAKKIKEEILNEI
tara:strand:- start:928 stop:1908 length:981 start_codon:yes stop_codon:yes gene_type:complete